MDFTHDTRVTLATAADLVNSGPQPETLAGAADVTGFLRGRGWSRHESRPGDVPALHHLRERLRRVWTADIATLAAEVNALLREAHALPQLVEHGQGYGWHVHATDDTAPICDHVAVEVALAIVDLVRNGEADRLQRCARPGCDGVLVDLSKNRSRKFCDTACANRAHAAAYRARRLGH